MEKQWLVVQADSENIAIAVKEALIKQGVEEKYNLLVCSKGVTVMLNGKELTKNDNDGLTATQIDDLKAALERRCNEHISVAKTTFNWLVWPVFIVAVLIALTWIAER